MVLHNGWVSRSTHCGVRSFKRALQSELKRVLKRTWNFVKYFRVFEANRLALPSDLCFPCRLTCALQFCHCNLKEERKRTKANPVVQLLSVTHTAQNTNLHVTETKTISLKSQSTEVLITWKDRPSRTGLKIPRSDRSHRQSPHRTLDHRKWHWRSRWFHLPWGPCLPLSTEPLRKIQVPIVSQGFDTHHLLERLFCVVSMMKHLCWHSKCMYCIALRGFTGLTKWNSNCVSQRFVEDKDLVLTCLPLVHSQSDQQCCVLPLSGVSGCNQHAICDSLFLDFTMCACPLCVCVCVCVCVCMFTCMCVCACVRVQVCLAVL